MWPLLRCSTFLAAASSGRGCTPGSRRTGAASAASPTSASCPHPSGDRARLSTCSKASFLPATERVHAGVHPVGVRRADARDAGCRRCPRRAASSSANGGAATRNRRAASTPCRIRSSCRCCWRSGSPRHRAHRLGWCGPWAALVNLVLCRYFFIHMRWKGVLRGMGAPGFMAYWLALAVFLLEYTQPLRAGPAGPRAAGAAGGSRVHHAVRRRLQVHGRLSAQPRHGARDGAIRCGATGGASGRRAPPDSAVFWTMNQLAWGDRGRRGPADAVPPTRELGAMLILVSFLFILTQIRLGFLCEMVMVCCLLFVVPRQRASTAGSQRRPRRPMTAGRDRAWRAGGERAAVRRPLGLPRRCCRSRTPGCTTTSTRDAASRRRCSGCSSAIRTCSGSSSGACSRWTS